MKKNPVIIAFAMFMPFMYSCNMDGLDFSKLSSQTNLTPEIVAPLAKADVTVYDLMQSANNNGEGTIATGSDGVVNIVYDQKDLFKYDLHDFIQFPNHLDFSSGNQTLGNLTTDDVSVSRNITLNDLVGNIDGTLSAIVALNGMTAPFPAVSYNGPETSFNLNTLSDFSTVTFYNGTLKIVMNNQLKVPVKISGSLYDMGYSKEISNFSFPTVNPGDSSVTTVSLAGLQISNQIEFRMMKFETPGSTTPVTIDLNDYFNLTFRLSNLRISSGLLSLKNQKLKGNSGSFDFNFPEPDLKAFAASLKSGMLSVRVTNSSQVIGNLMLTLPEAKQNGSPVEMSIPLDGTITNFDLSGIDLNFSSDQKHPYNEIPYTYSLQADNSNGYINYSSTDYLSMDVSLDNLEFQSVQGDFGKRQIQIDNGVFDMNVDFLNKLSGTFNLANPTLEVIIRNSVGMPATINMNYTGYSKDGNSVSLDPPAFDIPVPVSLNSGVATKTITIDKQNSNIVDFIALPPTGRITYSGEVDFNSTGQVVTPENPNFVNVDDTFAIDLAMKLPLQIQTGDLEFSDTARISPGDFDKLETAELTVNATNGVPLSVDLQLAFIDTLTHVQYGQTSKKTIVTAADVDAQGNITPVQSTHTFSLNASDLDNLRKSNAIVFSGTIISPSEGAGTATILSDSKIDLNAVIQSKVNL